ncbi:MAG: outer membrane beta-barrel protein, partial [Catalinimonas sp.]
FTDKFSMTAGYMGTFVGYEVIAPTGNFNYSTSYLFTNGPFQNAGVKAEYAFSDKVSLMVGLFNDWNVYTDPNGLSDFGAQLYLAPVDGWDVYLNLISGFPSGTEIDLTTGYQITDAFYLGLNAADWTASGENAGGFTGVALYPQVSLSDNFSLGLRYEYFTFKDMEMAGEDGAPGTTLEGEAYNAVTLSGNIKLGPLTVIPEVRLDAADQDVFIDSDAAAAGSAAQALIGVVYGF